MSKTLSLGDYTPVIGLEVHVQLATKSKMFDRCSADWFGKEPNTVVGPLTLGLPGTLPIPNKKAIQWAILVGKALNCKTNNVSKFDRKHYFYPDLPKSYQLSQYDQPFSYDGNYKLRIARNGNVVEKVIGITRAHLEEDTGKLIHKGTVTLVDFNRAGVPLLEIVTEPDFDNSDDVKQFLEELQVLVRYLGVSEANMERGSMRLEPNISLKKPGEKNLPNYKVEIKNINSFNFVKKAIDFELKRHHKLLEKGEIPVQETRGYNENKGITVSQRVKEEADDYRYMPEPDIPPFEFSKEFITEIEAMMLELPNEKVERFIKEYHIRFQDAYILTRNLKMAQYFEKVMNRIQKSDVRIQDIGQKIAGLIVNKKLPTNISTGEFARKALELIKPKKTDYGKLDLAINSVINNNPNPVQNYKNGKENVIMFLVGQVMKEMRGQADPQTVKKELHKKLST